MKHSTINHLDIFKFYRLEIFAASTLRMLVRQLLETYIDEGTCTALISLDKAQFEKLAQAYRDLCIGYKHPRQNSMSAHFSPDDETLMKLCRIFPSWDAEGKNRYCQPQ